MHARICFCERVANFGSNVKEHFQGTIKSKSKKPQCHHMLWAQFAGIFQGGIFLRNLFPLFSLFSLLESYLSAESTVEVSRPRLPRSSLLLPENIGTAESAVQCRCSAVQCSADGLGDTGKYQGNTGKYRHFIEMGICIYRETSEQIYESICML